MSPSLEYLERCSAETGYQVSPLEKVVRLGELAGDIARHPLLGEALALKGGTALNLCFGPPGRLSVDLDYNYIAHVEREKMLADRPRVEEAVAEIAERHGYRIQRSADAFAGRKAFLRYRSVLGLDERIEVDLNFLFRLPIDGTKRRPVWQPGGLDQPLVRLVGISELVAGKLLALLDRGAARDAWDAANLSETPRSSHRPAFGHRSSLYPPFSNALSPPRDATACGLLLLTMLCWSNLDRCFRRRFLIALMNSPNSRGLV